MSVSRTGALQESFKYYTISIDGFDGRLLRGQVYHSSLDHGLQFRSLSEMAFILEGMFERLHYPMKSVDQRNFHKKYLPGKSRDISDSQDVEEKKTEGSLGEFRLHVKYRFHATWQGDIKNLKDGKIFPFLSFLELMEYFNRTLGGDGGENPFGLGKKMCEVIVRNYEDFAMSGDVSHPAVDKRMDFCNEFDLREEIGYMLNPLPVGAEEEKLIVPRTVTVSAGNFGPATFVVRILFRRNATWQGTICWKEKRCQVSFRSFLEMLLLMQDAALCSEAWDEEPEGTAAVLA